MSSRRLPGRITFSWSKIVWLYAMIIPSIAFGWAALTVETVAIGVALGLATLCLGHSVGLHRGVIHRTYKTSRAARVVLTYLFVLTGLGGPLSWMRLHFVRDYWQNTPDCPRFFAYTHSIARDYIDNLHKSYEPDLTSGECNVLAEDLNDPWLRFLEWSWPLHNLALAGLLYAFGGWELVVVATCMRTAASILGHWFVGFVAHKHGSVRYRIEGATVEGTNTWFLGLISFGEGFHNNHHAYPSSARMGHAWYELDIGWWAVVVMERLGLVSDVIAFGRRTTGGSRSAAEPAESQGGAEQPHGHRGRAVCDRN